MRVTSRLRLLLAVLLSFAVSAPALAAEPGDPIVAFTAVGGRAFTPDGDGVGDRLELVLELSAGASLAVDVLDWHGRPTAALLPSPAVTNAPGTMTVAWDGAGAANGPYRVRATAITASGTFTRQIEVARVSALPYPLNPAAVTIFIDPGHGGDAPGGAEVRLPDGTLVREEVMNLEIALKLAAMLRSAGVRVSLSRTADVPANSARLDRNGDRRVDGTDDYLARIDGANRARADLFVSVHNNFIPGGKGRTEAFYCGVGCIWPPPSRALAAAILDAHVAALAPLQTPDWQLTVGDPEFAPEVRNPTDDALRFASATFAPGRHFYMLGPYHSTFRPRSLQMPAALIESLALSHPTELSLLMAPGIRTLLANAYYDGIVRWLTDRPLGLRFDTIAGGAPTTARVARTSTVRVRVTNNGTAAVPAGSAVLVGTVARRSPYDGSPSGGTTIGRTYLRAALAPGASTDIAIAVRPLRVGPALWKVDAVVGGVRTSARRVPFLQWAVTVRR
jgi:N-acetylmuramoyl-L-alanine amidase